MTELVTTLLELKAIIGERPNPVQTWSDLLWDLEMDFHMTGSAYVLKLPNGLGVVKEAWRMEPQTVTVFPNGIRGRTTGDVCVYVAKDQVAEFRSTRAI